MLMAYTFTYANIKDVEYGWGIGDLIEHYLIHNSSAYCLEVFG